MASRKLTQLRERKDRLIGRYLRMQDNADELNDRIYSLVVRIEALNLAIQAMEAEEVRLAAPGHGRNGKPAGAAPAKGSPSIRPPAL